MMGDYAQRTDIQALMQSWGRGQGATPHVADMAGARFVLSSQIPENRKINESLIKDLTGGDTMTARHLFSNPFTFKPVHKLWIYGNHKPRVTGTDWGFWRRMKVIPFNTSIPEDVIRPMSEVIQTFEAELSGILTWAVLGCIYWQNSGLETIQAVNDATSEYRTEQDIVQQFLDEKCEMHQDHSIEKKLLFDTWREWCEDNGEDQAKRRSKAWLTRQMTKRGFESGGRGGLFLQGLRLNNG
jgi:putative DNA primase/helicase